MTPMLETLSWIAAIVAVPVAVIDWFASRARRTTQSSTSEAGAAVDLVP
jgi:hypothetical protein